jgi:Zn-dependent protease
LCVVSSIFNFKPKDHLMEKSSLKEMEDPSQEDVISLVNSMFQVSDYNKTEFSLEFKIEDMDFKSKFESLARKLENMSYVCKLEKMEERGLYVIIQKFSQKKQRKWMSTSWTPRILFAIVISFVMIDGYYRTSGTNSIVEIGDPLEMAAIYTLSLLGILGVHELGHIIAAKVHGLKTTWPYFIPGLPIIGIPTFGAFIQSKGLTINREILFDVAIAGPIAGLAIAVIVSIYGAYTAPVLDSEIAAGLFEGSKLIEWDLGEPLLMTASLALFGKGGAGHEVIMTPIMFAAWIGFLITFLNLLPAWQLDGGHMARTLFGAKLHKYATYGSMAILVLLNYWLMALLILFMSSRNPSATPLDDISPLSKNRKLAYLGIIVLAILCAPLPSGFLSGLLP